VWRVQKAVVPTSAKVRAAAGIALPRWMHNGKLAQSHVLWCEPPVLSWLTVRWTGGISTFQPVMQLAIQHNTKNAQVGVRTPDVLGFHPQLGAY
jgi:hypothetical protein